MTEQIKYVKHDEAKEWLPVIKSVMAGFPLDKNDLRKLKETIIFERLPIINNVRSNILSNIYINIRTPVKYFQE